MTKLFISRLKKAALSMLGRRRLPLVAAVAVILGASSAAEAQYRWPPHQVPTMPRPQMQMPVMPYYRMPSMYMPPMYTRPMNMPYMPHDRVPDMHHHEMPWKHDLHDQHHPHHPHDPYAKWPSTPPGKPAPKMPPKTPTGAASPAMKKTAAGNAPRMPAPTIGQRTGGITMPQMSGNNPALASSFGGLPQDGSDQPLNDPSAAFIDPAMFLEMLAALYGDSEE